MPAAVPAPRRVGYLRIFLLSLAVLIVGLLGLLFGVTMEVTASGTGSFTVRGTEEVRAPRPGLIDLSWYDASVDWEIGMKGRYRLDEQGDGIDEYGREIHRCEDCPKGMMRPIPRESMQLHKLQPGDVLWPGQRFAVIRSAEWWHLGETRVLRAPAGKDHWLVAELHVQRGQGVAAGQRIVTLVPVDPLTGQPREWLAEMEVDEEHAAEIEVGQEVRLYSNLYNHRVHGTLDGVVERIDPTSNGGRFHVVAAVPDPPLRLMLGSGFRAEIVLGRKRVYRIILEH